ncbi:DUF6807 domain-containing protein [Maribacter ulvicola]|uniref:Methane oxygenase PmoA n=1 Tax=Maribacter ulvicola TaxID=228959 RepID=A0A1N6Y9T0_9FLAO|nr:PmoA family protein [Maribacter ulvicola]SIR11382.1 Methane oxygenase PmoA [Maribacter ulvicola]
MSRLIQPNLFMAMIASGFFLISCKNENSKKYLNEAQDVPKQENIQIIDNGKEQRVDILIKGKLFTSYRYPKNIKKPVLYPLVTPQGTKITRRFPMEQSSGERVDHPHHVGVWFNYGDVNGLDFWNNSDSIATDKKELYGTIVHKKINKIVENKNTALLEVTMEWLSPEQKTLMVENTTFIVENKGDIYTLDRITKLTAKEDVLFKDNKEGLLGVRVRRELEHPSNKPTIFTDVNGIPTGVPVLNNEKVKGKYVNSEGVEGEDTWGKRARWVNLTSNINGEHISLAIVDHSENIGYPTYWHTRGYGLFAANPLGQSVFSKGKNVLNFKLNKGESKTFKHRIVVASKLLDEVRLNKEFNEFSNK